MPSRRWTSDLAGLQVRRCRHASCDPRVAARRPRPDPAYRADRVVGVMCTAVRVRCRECGWSGDQQGYRAHSSLNRHVLVEVERPTCQPDEPPCEACASELPVHVEDQVRAELRDLAARDRAAAPSPDEVVQRMRLNGLVDPDLG